MAKRKRHTWDIVLGKVLSRKFLVALGAEVSQLVLLVGESGKAADTVESLILRLGLIAGMVLTAVGYIAVEGRNDGKAIERGEEKPFGFTRRG